MRRRLLILKFVLIIGLSSCNLPGTTATPLSQPTPVTLPTSTVPPTAIPIETLLAAAELPTVTPTSMPSISRASPKEQPVNCRFGPDISYAVIGALNVGRQAEIIGKNADVTWMYVRNPSDPSTNCWLSVDFINVTGNVDLLPAVGPPEIMVTNIEVRVEPPAMNVACDAFPQSVIIVAEISTNGPSIVRWNWQSSSGKRSVEDKDILFEEAGTKTVQDYYQVDGADDYSITVGTLLPNLVAGSTTFKVTCTP
jgi:hypothetical protein